MPILTSRDHNRIVFEGVAAVVRLGYQTAARLGPWRVEDRWLTAAVQFADMFRITQGPLTLEIPNADGIPTRRALVDVTVSAGQLQGRILPKG